MLMFTLANSGSWLDRLFGLTEVSWSDPNVALGWEHPLPRVVWLGVALAAAALAGWSYSKLLGGVTGRVLLAICRAVLLVVLALLLAGPMLVRTEDRVEPDCLIVMLDRSASLGVADATGEGDQIITRDAQLRHALEQHPELFGDTALGEGRQVVWMGFGGRAEVLPERESMPELPDADRPATAIGTALRRAIETADGRPISAIVLASDGTTPQSLGADLTDLLNQRAASVFAVPLGAAAPGLDLAVTRVDAPREAFVGDIVPVSVIVEQLSGRAIESGRATLALVDHLADRVLDEQPVTPEQLGQPIRLSTRGESPGEKPWRIELRYVSDAAIDRDMVPLNNTQDLDVTLVDRPLRVLYVEGYPRWDYRYLKNLLIREESIACSTLLLSADRGFVQEGDVPITRLPNDAEEMRAYDVIVIGDVPSTYFSLPQLTLIRDAVAVRGAGVLWIGGPRDLPRSYADTMLEPLLPMRDPAAVREAELSTDGLRLKPTPLADRLDVLRLRGPDAEDDAAWPDALPPLLWAQDLTPLSPTAEVLATSDDGELPLIVRTRYGAGQSIYVATDETWRWRFGRGELYFEQYWIQLIRALGRARSGLADGSRLSVSAARVDAGQNISIELMLDSAARTPRESVGLVIENEGGATQRVVLRVEPADPESDAADPGVQRFVGNWQPTEPGRYTLTPEDAVADASALRTTVEVLAPDDELRHITPDHDALVRLASATGGAVVPVGEMERLRELVPNRARRTPHDVREPIWNSAIALVLVLTLLTAEWIGRKVIRLV